MSRAGYDLGVEIGQMMEHQFRSAPARITAMIGRVLGILLLAGGLLVCIFDWYMEVADGELVGPSLLAAAGGVVLLLVLHWVALQIDKKPDKD